MGDIGAVVVVPNTNGVTMMSVLSSSASPTSTSYDVALPTGETLRPDPLGGVMVVEGGVMVGRFSAPWAIDAANRSLSTSYSVSGSTITQTVDTAGAIFPIVADPKYTWGWVTGSIYFNKHETAIIAAGSATAAGFAAFLAPPFSWVVAGELLTLSFLAQWDVIDNRCLSLKSTGQANYYSGSSEGGYCR